MNQESISNLDICLGETGGGEIRGQLEGSRGNKGGWKGSAVCVRQSGGR